MSDKDNVVIEDTERPETITIDDVYANPRKRPSRGKTQHEPDEAAPKVKTKPTPVRAAKLDGKDVQQMFEICSGMAVYLGAGQHWLIPGAEVAPFAKEMAELLNRIPARYASAVIDMSGFAVVGVGMVKVFKPRIDYDRMLKAQQNGHVPNEPIMSQA